MAFGVGGGFPHLSISAALDVPILFPDRVRLGPLDGGFGRHSSVERRERGGDLVYAAASDVRADGIGLAY